MIPVLVAPPTAEVVSLGELKAQCGIDHDDLDSRLVDDASAFVATLDGWGGILGRAIMPQTWAQEWTCSGPYRLALPDAADLVVTVDGVATMAFTTKLTTLGLVVTVEVSGDLTRIEYTCALPDHKLISVKKATLLAVHRDYDMFDGPKREAYDRSIDGLLNPLRWTRL